MAAEKGNKYAEKWTEETVLEQLENMEKILLSNSGKELIYIGELLSVHYLYKEIWSYWKKTFSSNLEVFQAIKRIEQEFENRLYVKALKNEVVASVAIFGLKNNHKWSDRTEVDVTSGGEAIKLTMDLSK